MHTEPPAPEISSSPSSSSSSASSASRPPARRRGRFVPMVPAAAPGSTPQRTPSRRRVYATRGLAASAAVLALSVQAGQAVGEPGPTDGINPCAACGDPAGPGAATTA